MGDMYDSMFSAFRQAGVRRQGQEAAMKSAQEEERRRYEQWVAVLGLEPGQYGAVVIPTYGTGGAEPLAYAPSTDELFRTRETLSLIERMPKTERAWERFAASLGL